MPDTTIPGQRRYVCMLCMYVFDESIGDPDSGIAPGTLWEDIPDDWCCPKCGAAKEYFELEARFSGPA
jgi:rubredoxin